MTVIQFMWHVITTSPKCNGLKYVGQYFHYLDRYFFKYVEISRKNAYSVIISTQQYPSERVESQKVKPAAFVGGILVGTPTGIIKEFCCRLFH